MGSEVKRRAYVGDSYVISSLGFGIAENCDFLAEQKTNTGLWEGEFPICSIDNTKLQQKVEEYALFAFTKVEQLSIIAIEELQCDRNSILESDKTLFILSTTKGDIDLLSTNIEKCFLANTADVIARYFGLKNTPIVVSNACISGLTSIIIASDFVRRGVYDNVIVVGVDIISEFVIRGFNSFKSISKNICRPYDLNRDGLTIGEACGSVVITSTKNKGSIEIAGGANSNDANHISGPSRSGDGLALAMRGAMEDANVTSLDIDFVNSHGTATVFNDEMESKAITLEGLNDVPLNCFKQYIGHTLGASGVVESILCCEQLRCNTVYGVRGFTTLGVPHALNISAENRTINAKYALKTASGFGGCNSAIVLKKSDDEVCLCKQNIKIESETVATVEITECNGVHFKEFIKEQYKALGESNIKFYKMDNLSKLGYIASLKLLKGFHFDCESSEIALILSNRSSSLDSDLKHLNCIDTMPVEEISPAIFVYTLANIVAGEIAIKHKIQGETTFFISESYNEKFMRGYAESLFRKGVKYVIYGWCELLGSEYSTKLTMIKNRY